MTAKAIVNNKEKVFDKSSNEWIEEKDATCDCGRKIPEDCLLEHFLDTIVAILKRRTKRNC